MVNGVGNGLTVQTMRADIKEKDGQYLIEIELPGYQRENITASLENGYLTISAVRNPELEAEKFRTHYIMRERPVGEVTRTFAVGEKIQQEDVTAALKDGILSIIISTGEDEIEGARQKLIPIL